MAGKTTILFLAANAVDTGILRLGEEVREIEQKIQSTPTAKSFNFISKWAVRPHDITEALMRYRPTIVHFSGHATATHEIVLEDDNGKSKHVGTSQLVDMLSVFKDSIRLLVLNACFSNVEIESLSNAVDYIVGTNSVIGDRPARTFAAAFYQALGYGYSVQTAFEVAKRQITLEGLHGAEIFNLLIRDGVNVSEPFVKRRSRIVKSSRTTTPPPPSKLREDKGNVISILEKIPTLQPDTHIIPSQQSNSGLQAIGEYPQGGRLGAARDAGVRPLPSSGRCPY